MWLLKQRLVLVVSIIYTVLATAEVPLDNGETAAASNLLPEDTEQVVGRSATQSIESLDVSEPLESNLINLDEEPVVDRSSDKFPLETDKENVQEPGPETLTANEASQGEYTPPMEEDVVSDEEVNAPRENDNSLDEPVTFPQEDNTEDSEQETKMNEDCKEGSDDTTKDPIVGDIVLEPPGPDSEIVEETDVQNTITMESIDTEDLNDSVPISEMPFQTENKTSNLPDDEGNNTSIEHSAEPEIRENSKQLQSNKGSDETAHVDNNEQSETMNDTVSDSPADDETQFLEEPIELKALADEIPAKFESKACYQPNCGAWGVYQPDSPYANISILALLFQDLFQKDEAEAAAILKDLASSVTMPMQDVLDKMNNVSEEINEIADLADIIKRSPNSEFVDGLDDIDKFFEGVDVPDELDVGAAGSSIQEVLMGQGTQIVIKRLKMGFAAIQDAIMTMKVSAVESIEDIVSRREEFATKRDVILRRLQDGKIVFIESVVEFRDGDNERRKELLQQLARFSWRTTVKTTNAFKEFVERLFEDGEDIQDILKESTAVDDEIQKMLRKLS